MQIKVKKLHPAATIPKYATEGAACFDICAATVDGFDAVGTDAIPGCSITVGTGLAFEIPFGHVMLVYSRSGHGFKSNTRLANCVGVIDSDYRGELMVKLTTDSIDDRCGAPLTVGPGDRIAQAMVIPFPRVEFIEADDLTETERGTGGLGSTGQ